MGIPMLKIRRSQDRLIFNIGIPILVRQYIYIETPPGSLGYDFCEVIIGLDNGLAPNRWQAFVWTDDHPDMQMRDYMNTQIKWIYIFKFDWICMFK